MKSPSRNQTENRSHVGILGMPILPHERAHHEPKAKSKEAIMSSEWNLSANKRNAASGLGHCGPMRLAGSEP
jgi:hypothetical protein